MDDGAARLLTWNLQGARGLDVARVESIIRSVSPDIVALQEVQRRQASALAGALSMSSRRWAFKHWPLVARAEGLAVLTPHELAGAANFTLRRAPFWAWRRRIGLDATVVIGPHRVRIIQVHLSPHDAIEQRRHEAAVTLARVAPAGALPMIVGDLNDLPDGVAYAAFVEAGWVDAWRAVHGAERDEAGATNWTPGDRRGRLPTQRIDYILAPPGSVVVGCAVVAERADIEGYATLSDHLPLTAQIRLADADAA